MKLIFKLGIILYLVVSLLGCESGNLEVDRPGYLRIDSFQVNYLDPSTTGLGDSKITDAWVFLDGDLLSVMPLPGEIPLPELGNRTLTIGPGIRVNGIAATRDEFPFYTRIDTLVTVNSEASIQINPTVTYTEAATFAFVEDFESSALRIDSTTGSDIGPQKESLDQTSNTYGNFIGFGKLDTTKTDMKFITGEFMELPQGGVPVYMELDYRTNALVIIGIAYRTADPQDGIQEFPYLFLQPTDRETGTPVWNKVYVELTREISGTLNATEFAFTLSGAHESSNTVSEFYFDNLKIVHR